MSTIPIFDCFPYFNEPELLEFRLRLLWNHVHGFIITEADHTFSGIPKPYTCVTELKRLGVPMDKVRVMQVQVPGGESGMSAWHRERQQRDAVQLLMQPHTVYVVSDCDEIIDPLLIPQFVQGVQSHPSHILRITMAWLMCRADLRVCCPKGIPAGFDHAFVCTQDHVTHHTLSEIREDHACALHRISFPSLYLQDANQQRIMCGWHLSWMGGTHRMRTKMRSYSHYQDPQQGIFETAVGAVNSPTMHEYLDSYVPAPGSLDPYGRSDYHLQPYDTTCLPPLMHEIHHLKPYFFGNMTT